MRDGQAPTDDLLARYRSLCEASGIARAHAVRLAPPALAELSRLETLLRDLLARAGTPVQPRDEPGDELAADAPALTDPAAEASAPVAEAGPERPAPTKAPAPAAAGAVIYCDGSSEGNPGPGGYGAVVRVPGRPDRELSGGARRTTNNQMELIGAIVGLKAAIEDGAAEFSVVTDSEYVVKGMSSWVAGWMRNGWKTATGGAVKNRELWEELAQLAKGHAIRWEWVRGHNGHPENERCHALAIEAARKVRI